MGRAEAPAGIKPVGIAVPEYHLDARQQTLGVILSDDKDQLLSQPRQHIFR